MAERNYQRDYWRNGRHVKKKRHALGLCPYCGKPRMREGWYCNDCLQKSRASRKPAKEKTKEEGYLANLKRHYRLTEQEAVKLVANRPNHCEVCGKRGDLSSNRKYLDLDHDHKTGKVRGWLCRNCNRILGFSGDDAKLLGSLVAYLRRSDSTIAGQAT